MCCCCTEKAKLDEHLKKRAQWAEEFEDAGGEIPQPPSLARCDDLEFILCNMHRDPKEVAKEDIAYREKCAALKRKILTTLLTLSTIAGLILLFTL